jgi:hypothetical protein
VSDPIRLSTAKIRVVLGDVDDPSGWRELTVQTILRDQTFAETELARSKRGPLGDHSILAVEMTAFFGLKRTGQIQSGTFADFEAGCLDLEVIEEEALDPTPLEQPPG